MQINSRGDFESPLESIVHNMYFETGRLYHIYNQGNNKIKIFYSKRNYLFFKEKIREYIVPYSDLLAYARLPNHFHLLIHLNLTEITHGVTSSHTVSKSRSFNDSIGIMLRSYTRAINKEQKRSGSLFREGTKAVCLNKPEGISPSWYTRSGVTEINIQRQEFQYPQICFDYIHFNPVKHNLVKVPEKWGFSSFFEYTKDVESMLINKKKAIELGFLLE